MSKKMDYKKILGFIKGFLYGMVGFETESFARVTRGSLEHLFILLTMGNILGIPVPLSYYYLRLLPFIVPKISIWKRKMLQEKDLIDVLI